MLMITRENEHLCDPSSQLPLGLLGPRESELGFLLLFLSNVNHYKRGQPFLDDSCSMAEESTPAQDKTAHIFRISFSLLH